MNYNESEQNEIRGQAYQAISNNDKISADLRESISSEDHRAIKTYSDLIRKWHDPIFKKMISEIKANPASVSFLEDYDENDLLKQSRHNQDLLWTAVQSNDWKDYIQNLEVLGKTLAEVGFAFKDWIGLITAFRDHMHPYVLQEFPDDASKVSLIWKGAAEVNKVAFQVVSGAYFEEKNSELQKEQRSKDEALKSLRESEEKFKALSEKLEEKVEERTAELKMINSELESFSYTVSHDLRAPLRAMGGYARILKKQVENQLSEEQNRYLTVVIDNVSKMGNLIDDLLLYSRIGRANTHFSRLDMTLLARQVFDDTLEPEVDKHVELNLHDLPAAMGDWEMLKRVFSNLFANAIKFTQHIDQPKISVTSHETDKEVIYAVADNGVGFEMEYAHKLFGMFQRLHSADEYEGTGVGLAIVQRIIHKHGGRVWAEGELQKGASFYFSLPKENSSTK